MTTQQPKDRPLAGVGGTLNLLGDQGAVSPRKPYQDTGKWSLHRVWGQGWFSPTQAAHPAVERGFSHTVWAGHASSPISALRAA